MPIVIPCDAGGAVPRSLTRVKCQDAVDRNARGMDEWLFLEQGEHDPELLQWEVNVNGLGKSCVAQGNGMNSP